MNNKQLIESCRRAISSGRCLGCTALENPNFIGNVNCRYGQPPSAKQSIEQIKLNLGIKEALKSSEK